VDGWAGGRPHSFTIVFGLKHAPAQGECMLTFDLVDTQQPGASGARVTVNGKPMQPAADQTTFRLPRGGGDDSYLGQPAKGKPATATRGSDFPASLLKAGGNELALTTRSGSWLLYDSVRRLERAARRGA